MRQLNALGTLVSLLLKRLRCRRLLRPCSRAHGRPGSLSVAAYEAWLLNVRMINAIMPVAHYACKYASVLHAFPILLELGTDN